LQLNGKKNTGGETLAELRRNGRAIIERLDMPEDVARRMMELGFIPGAVVVAARGAPGGDPQVFRVDGTEIALRRETARHIHVRMSPGPS
jgi:ferrous iron transport protein A